MQEVYVFLEKVKKTSSQNTYKSYKKAIEIFLDFFQSNLDISYEQAQKFVNVLLEKYSKRSVAQRISALN
ncbi:MAG: site-specific integrase, partial [Candidatus Kapaibacteriota bacterium]